MNTEVGNGSHVLKIKKSGKSLTRRSNIEWTVLIAPAILLIMLFNYVPMFGLVIAFQNFNAIDGIFGSPWVGFRNFEFFFTSQDAWRITWNTLFLNSVFIVTGLVFQVTLALLLYEVKKKFFIKTYQTVMILPHFISWVIAAYMLYAFLNPAHGVANATLVRFGFEPIAWYHRPELWPWILTISNLWKTAGIGCIMYYAALMGIDPTYYEAAQIDGATKWQSIRHISIPMLKPIMIIMTILALGGIFRADFGMFFQLTRDSGLLYRTTDVIDTYIFRALRTIGNPGMSAAVGLYQSVIGFICILSANFAVRKIEPDSALF